MKYSLHRALALKKSTEERIIQEIDTSVFISIRQGKKGTINGVPVEKVETDIKATYDKVIQLIENYIKIKNAILRSNAGIREDVNLHTVEVAGKKYTMAELISASDEVYGNKKHSMAFKVRLLSRMKDCYSSAIRKIELQHQRIEMEIKDYLAKAAASDKGMTSDEIKMRSDVFHEDGDYILVDPLDLKSKIEELEKEIKEFRTECDATMSEENALNQIDVDLTTI